MSELRYQAVTVANRLNQENRIDYGDYSALMDGLEEIDTLRERDKILEDLWAKFGDVPMNPETECTEAPFLGFPAGTFREDIWRWFDERYSKGVASLMYGGSDLTKYRVRVSQLRYGDVEVEAVDEKSAKTLVAFSTEQINWFDAEFTDMTVERID